MIKEFQGEYRWLSNFMPCEVYLEGIEYKSVEHAYMSAKSSDPAWKTICQTTESPGHVKRQSCTIAIRKDWEFVKKTIMLECLIQKYKQEPYKTNLINTGDLYIQEGNTWGDKFWGIDLRTGHGQNNLGLMIMNIRTDLQYNNISNLAENKNKSYTVETKAPPVDETFRYWMEHGTFPD